MKTLRETLLDKREFAVTCELIPGRGHRGKSIERVEGWLERLREKNAGAAAIHALSLTDNAGGNPAFSADMLGAEIVQAGVDAIVHFSTKDLNRNLLESRAYALGRAGVRNLLVLSGDYPVSGFLGTAKPVFDMDSVVALHYLQQMNQGLTVQLGRRTETLAPTEFFLGAVVSPFKWTEGPLIMQYYKLEKKLRAGAQFIISQLGYDARKYIELIQYVRTQLNSDVPVLGSVYVLSAGAARIMHAGEVPGCYVGEEFLQRVRKEATAEDKGKAARLERAARQVALLKGLGYNGAHIEGLNLKYEDVQTILGRAAEIGADWSEHLGEFDDAPENPFYYFEGGDKLRAPAADTQPVPQRTRRPAVGSPKFWMTRLLHKMLFIPDTLGYRIMRGVSRFADAHKRFLSLLAFSERATKKVLFDCRQCDDCALFDTYYLCPESKCPKGMRNGPCGGSRPDGRCEVFEDRYCIWHHIYRRAKNRKELDKLRTITAPRNWALYETSSWVNYYLGRDHSGHPLPIAEPPAESPAGDAPGDAPGNAVGG